MAEVIFQGLGPIEVEASDTQLLPGKTTPARPFSTTTPQNLVFYPEDYGALGDSTNDDTQAIQTAMDWAMQVNGIVQFQKRRYRITAPLNVRKGMFTMRGVGQTTTASEKFYTAGDQYDTYANGPANGGVGGTVLWFWSCDGFIRDDVGAQDFCLKDLALVSRNIGAGGLFTCFAFGTTDRSYTQVYKRFRYSGVAAYHWQSAFNNSLGVSCSYWDCVARGCLEGLTEGNATVQGYGAIATDCYHTDLQSNHKCIALYESDRLAMTGAIAQGHITWVHLAPNGPARVRNTAIRDVYLETVDDPNYVLYIDDSGATVANACTAELVSLENTMLNTGPNTGGYNFGTGKHGSGVAYLHLDRVNTVLAVVTMPSHISPVTLENLRTQYLTIQSPFAFAALCQSGNAFQGVKTVIRGGATQALSLPSSTTMGGGNYTGNITFGATDRVAGAAFNIVREPDTNYGILYGFQSASGAAATGSYLVLGVTQKSTAGFNLVLSSAPGGSAAVNYRWLLVR